MRTLGIDLGEKRIGLALSDPLGVIASPLEVFEFAGQEEALKHIAAVVRQKGVEEIVVGLPLMMNGTCGPKAEEAKEFAAALQNRVEAPVVCWDERLTTTQAQRALLEGDVSRAGRKMRVDMVAAALLLQSYLDSRPQKSF